MIQLTWEDPATGERREPRLNVPIAFGRECDQMPSEIGGERVSRIILSSDKVSRYHALIKREHNQLVVIDQNSTNCTLVNSDRCEPQKPFPLSDGDTLQIGSYRITLTIRATPLSSNFPPPVFQEIKVRVQALYATGYSVDECDYATIGAGLGSFIWVDFLRICGVQKTKIVALGIQEKPYGHYKDLCLNSQIRLFERLRSNCDSCPDNIWGFPSYAWREAWQYFTKGELHKSLRYLWQVFAEPTFAETYTPCAGNIFDSIDREAKRIGWEQIYRFGGVRAIRKTDDNRYCLAYSRGKGNYAFLVACYLHLATGYPGIELLLDLQAYRKKYLDFKSVVNAYEPHNHVYEQLERQGGKVLIRGRGIVSSRIIQRLYEARQRNQNITVLHLMQSPKPQGNKFDKTQRLVKNHCELQPFNWPKACWGGELKEMLEKAIPKRRENLL